MSLNWKEIDLALSELDLAGAQIQKVTQTAYDVICLHTYKEGRARSILVALTPGACRIHETFRAVPKSDKPLRFGEFLKSRVRNARIEEAVQLGTDRIVRFTLRHDDERLLLYVRLWTNAANVVVTDGDGLVLDAMRRSPKRGEISGGRYAPVDVAAQSPENKPKKEFEVRSLPGEGNFNERIDAWYAEFSGALSLEVLREQVRKNFAARYVRLQAALETLEEKRKEYADADAHKRRGELILANIAAVRPSSAWLDAVDYSSGEELRIRLDPRKSASANAEACFDQYRKAKHGLAEVEAEIAAEKAEIEALRGSEKILLDEENPLRLLKALRSMRVSAKTTAKKRPGLAFRRNGWLMLVGRGAEENDELLRRHVKGSDLWLHARDFPGAYVFVKARSGKTYPLDVMLDAGNLALFYSKGRNSGEGDLYYTQAKYLRRAKDGPKGLVLPTHEKNIRVKLDEARLRALEACKE